MLVKKKKKYKIGLDKHDQSLSPFQTNQHKRLVLGNTVKIVSNMLACLGVMFICSDVFPGIQACYLEKCGKLS